MDKLNPIALDMGLVMPEKLWGEARRVRFVTRLLSPAFSLRRLPLLVKYGASLSIIGVFYFIRLYFIDQLESYPFLLFFPAVITAAILFNHGSGVVAALAAVVLGGWILHVQGQLHEQFGVVAVSAPIFLFMALAVEALQETSHILKTTLDALHQRKVELERADEEKNVLIRESAHRVRNDLATLAAMVRLQSRRLTGPGKAAMETVDHRLSVLVRLHQRLSYDPGATQPVVNSREFLSDLVDELRVGHEGVKPINIDSSIEGHRLAHQTAVALGIIVNESVTNAMKYAFETREHGVIHVRFYRNGESYCLRVVDDGVNVGVVQGTGLGTRLMQQMTLQLDGHLAFDRTNGTQVEVIFPVTQP